MGVTLADEIARAAVETARLRPGEINWLSQRVGEWERADLSHAAMMRRAILYARDLICHRTPSPNSPATGGRP